VNHATIQTRCHRCEHIAWKEGEQLECCPVNRMVKFTGKNAITDTVNHLFFTKRVKKSFILAHGGGKKPIYQAVFIFGILLFFLGVFDFLFIL